MTKKILIVGGHGKIALLATPMLAQLGFDVTSVFRNPDHEAEVRAVGTTPLCRSLTELSVADWTEILRNVDIVVWSAGAGGKGTAADTYAIDRDGALTMITALEQLGSARLIMVSYFGSVGHSVPENDGFFPYADAKETVDKQLGMSSVKSIVLAPALLTLEPSRGAQVLSEDHPATGLTTSRELVAQVIAEVATRSDWPPRIAFVDGDHPVSEIF